MPIYEYRCLKYGEKFDELCSVHSRLEVKCPKCGGQKVEKLLSGFGFRIFGSIGKPVCLTCVPRR